jgi:DNA-directed RNA polymerase specialized sigma24 family protein
MDTRILKLVPVGELTHEECSGKLQVTLQDQVAQIYEALRDDVFRYLVLIGVPPDEAQELCQDVFLRLYTALRKGQQVSNQRAWVFTVARNCAITARATSVAPGGVRRGCRGPTDFGIAQSGKSINRP